MPENTIDISINDPQWEKRSEFDCKKLINDTITLAISEGFSYLGKSDLTAEISIVLADNSFVQNLNKTYRDKDKPTNVLSFPQTEIDEFDSARGEVSLGDIIIAYGVIEQEAQDQEKDFKNHLRHMLVHGTLHLMHFDHIHDEEAEEMETLEIEILKKMNIKNPYEI